LGDGELRINEIAFAADYSDALYFSSEFRRFHGVSPKEYRRRNLTAKIV
jgi:AraC-like DNA-binding protein